MFEKILNNPGLQHLAENIFDNLKFEDLVVCREINQSSKRILDYQMDKQRLTLDKPMFIMLRKFRSLSKKNQKDWIKVIQSEKNSDKGKAISSYLQLNLKKEALVDLPCYTNSAVQNDFRKRIRECCEKSGSSDEDTEIIKILAPLTENPNAANEDGRTPIYWAAVYGRTEILSPFDRKS